MASLVCVLLNLWVYPQQTVPNRLCVNVNRSNSLQKKLDHFQEGIAGLFGTAKFFCDVSLKVTNAHLEQSIQCKKNCPLFSCNI